MNNYSNHEDNKRFISLVLSCQKDIYVFILSLVLSSSDADDILQDTLTTMWEKFDHFEPGTNFISWGKTIARFKVMNYMRKNKNSKLQFDSEILHLIESESSQLANLSDRIDALKDCMKNLPGKDLKIMKMRYEQDLTFKKMGLEFGISKQSVYRTVSRIHCALVKCVKRKLSAGGSYV